MAVASSVTLPSQPTLGSLTYVPLGGDGFSAPHSAYALQNHAVDGAAGGGANALTVKMDPRFCALVSFVTVQIEQTSSADADVRIVVTSQTGGVQIPQLTFSDQVTAISKTVNQASIGVTWNPPALILPGAGQAGQIVVQTLNVDDDLAKLSCLIYNFDIRVRELTAMGPLLWARGST